MCTSSSSTWIFQEPMPAFCSWTWSSAFKVIIPALLHNELSQAVECAWLHRQACRWSQAHSLSGSTQPVKLEKHVSDSLTISTPSAPLQAASFLFCSCPCTPTPLSPSSSWSLWTTPPSEEMSMPSGGKPTIDMWTEQLGAQCSEDGGDGCGFQKEPSPACPHPVPQLTPRVLWSTRFYQLHLICKCKQGLRHPTLW